MSNLESVGVCEDRFGLGIIEGVERIGVVIFGRRHSSLLKFVITTLTEKLKKCLTCQCKNVKMSFVFDDFGNYSELFVKFQFLK